MREDQTTLDELQRIATHILSRARAATTGFISLRVAHRGITTPAFGSDATRVRTSGGTLVVEAEGDDGASARAMSMNGATLRELAELADVDLDTPLHAGADAPPVGDPSRSIDLDEQEVRAISDWYALAGGALDDTIAVLNGRQLTTTGPRLWPEHFDVAIEVPLDGERGINLGGSPGDSFSREPYVYVGPWGPERPGDAAFWNAPFGAFATRGSLAAQPEQAVEFFLDGVDRLTRI